VALVAEDAAAHGWVDGWTAAEAAAQDAIEKTLATREHAPSASSVLRSLLASAADDETLFVASSMPIRDLEWFGAPRDGARVLSNRGANGIDGLVSTAAGVAWAVAPHPVTAVLGDLAFLHDVGGLRAAAGLDNLDYVVIDNDGGAIFDFLPQATELDADTFRTLFTTPHGLDLAAVAAAVPDVRVAVHRVPAGTAAATHRAVQAAVAAAIGALGTRAKGGRGRRARPAT
jgi:2-succinyl-5-enolpyruvyl-6-hydroxy-3-cyclohexene-1-carboxylate synthase